MSSFQCFLFLKKLFDTNEPLFEILLVCTAFLKIYILERGLSFEFLDICTLEIAFRSKESLLLIVRYCETFLDYFLFQ